MSGEAANSFDCFAAAVAVSVVVADVVYMVRFYNSHHYATHSPDDVQLAHTNY